MTSNRRDGGRIGRKRIVKEQEVAEEEEENEEAEVAAAMAAWTERGPVPCGFR